MATLALHSDSSASAFARAGDAMLRRWANAEILVVDHAFAALKRATPTEPMLGGAQAHSTRIEIDALASDIEAAPVELIEQTCIAVDGKSYVIVDRIDRPELGQVTLHLEPAR